MIRINLVFRNLIRYRRYTIPNILGLGIGIGTLIVIFQFVTFQLSFDQFYTNDLYRVVSTKFQNGEVVHSTTVTYSAVGPALVNNYPEVINQTRVFPFGNSMVNTESRSINVSRCVAVEQSFFEMFELKLLAGDPNTVFLQPNQVVFTRSTATNVIGNSSFQDMIGESVMLDNDPDVYTLVGVVEDLPENSHLKYNLFLSYPTIINTWGIPQARYDWNMLDFRHYVQLKSGTNKSILNEKLAEFGTEFLDMTNSDYELFELEDIEDIYLSDRTIAYDIALKGDQQTIWILLSLGLVLFVVSLINFVNLNSSLGLKQSKNISIRKVLGAGEKSLHKSLIANVLTVYGLAICLGLMISLFETTLLKQNDFEIKSLLEMEANFIYQPLLISLIALLILGGLVASFSHLKINKVVKPVDALNARHGNVLGSNTASKVLLGLQFVLSIIAFSLGLIVFDQQEHLKSARVGFNLENLWVIHQPRLTASDSTFKLKLTSFKSDLTSNPIIASVTTNQRTPGQQVQVDYQAKMSSEQKAVGYLFTDQDYLDTYGIALLAGRNFNEADITDSFRSFRGVIVSKRLVEEFGYGDPENAINERIELFGTQRLILGVFDDFRQLSLLHDYQPLVLIPFVSSNNQIVIKTAEPPSNWLSGVQDSFESFFPRNSFEYRHLETEYHSQYASVYSAGKSLGFFTFLTIAISLFGMVALASLNLLSRIREISIRKVLGASNSRLYGDVIRGHVRLLMIAFMISIPAIFYLSEKWIEQFQSRITIGFIHYFLPILIMTAMISATLFLISRKVVVSNPSEVLKAE